MLTNLKSLLDHAETNQYAIPAFNVNNLEQIIAVRQAAVELDSPVIFQISNSAIQYANVDALISCIHSQLKVFPQIPFVIHRDHAHCLDDCVDATEYGFSSVMIDGSLLEDGKTPATFECNLKITKEVAGMLHQKGISVEGELGILGSLETKLATKEGETGAEGVLKDHQLVTSVEEAKEFVNQTGVDALAIAVGTSHGAYKFKSADISSFINHARIMEIHKALPSVHLVLHGASSIPEEWIHIINENGGQIDCAKGLPEESLLKCVRNGIRKVNIDTDLRVVFIGAQRLYLSTHKDTLDLRKILGFCVDEMSELIKHKYLLLGCEGQASRFR